MQNDDEIATSMLETAAIVTRVAGRIREERAEELISLILSGKRIYVTGAGRSGLVAKAFAMRLMHLGFTCYVIGETITPAFESGDVLIAFSGSGETKSVVNTCEKVRELGGIICLITANIGSKTWKDAEIAIDLGESSGDHRISPQEYEIRQITGQYRSASVPIGRGAVFEMVALIFSDAIISALMKARHLDPEEVRRRFSNMQ
ncbi:6-phospho-3-hexuloisomerase [Methanocalculus alkaliphilus]|uniref:SIS domain-containing protein n=1 Tax=Methanocalculus alkaliphilus TaxID=768730 RepID=UPI00209F198B|nr:SIS domain-containing protein [Methanocalculus alkaliphilus]MCP1714345.1 6-phospho-3-hexuloisomerase [Methanocalculus alkaliphilus]